MLLLDLMINHLMGSSKGIYAFFFLSFIINNSNVIIIIIIHYYCFYSCYILLSYYYSYSRCLIENNLISSFKDGDAIAIFFRQTPGIDKRKVYCLINTSYIHIYINFTFIFILRLESTWVI